MFEDQNDTTAGAAPVVSERRIVIARTFDAPRELVWKAWTDPKHLARWWGPHLFDNSTCEMDLRVGGAFGVHMRGSDGAYYLCKGVFREIVPPQRIVYVGEAAETCLGCGGGLPPRALVTITFDERRGRTTLTIDTRFEADADRDAAIATGFNEGWIASFDRLAASLSRT